MANTELTATKNRVGSLTRVFVTSAAVIGILAVAAIIWVDQEILTASTPDEIHWTITGPTSVTVDWRGGDGSLQYGLTSSYGSSITGATPTPIPFSSTGPFYEAKISGLTANTNYHYRVGGGGVDHLFHTPPPPGTTFTVGVEGDIGDSSSYSQVTGVQSLISTMHPDLVLAVGDLTYGNAGGQTHVDQHFNDTTWSLDAAYMPAWGNHEWDKPCSQGYNPCDDFRNYKGRFDLPNPKTSPVTSSCANCTGKDWYWFDYGNVRFIAYPEPASDHNPPASDSTSWTDWNTNMTNATNTGVMDVAQADPNIKYIVTFGHRPAYSSGHHPGESTLKTIEDALATKFPKYVLNLNGHSHDYERTFPCSTTGCTSASTSGVIHVTAGMGGGTLETDGTCLWLGGCPAPSFTAYRAMHHGALQVVFGANGIRGTFICGPAQAGKNDVTCNSGDILDTFTIGTPPAVSALITDPTPTFPIPDVPKPAYLAPIIDPTFGTTVTRISGDGGTPVSWAGPPGGSGTWSADARQHYSKDQPWNADQSLIALENSGSGGLIFLDGSTYAARYGKCSGYSRGDDRWHPAVAHKNERINVKSGTAGALEWYDVVNCAQTRRWDLPFAVQGFGPGEGNSSNDGRYVALVGTNPSTAKVSMFVVDMDPQAPYAPYPAPRIGPAVDIETNCGLTTGCNSIDWVSISPSGKYAVVSYDGDHPRVFDVNPTTLALTARPLVRTVGTGPVKECSGHDPNLGMFYDLGHADMTLNPYDTNEDVIVGQRRSWCDTVTTDDRGLPIGNVIMVRLRDGQVVSLTNPTNEATVHHISARDDGRPGWVYAGYKNNEGGPKYSDEILAIKLDGSAATNTLGSVERFGFKHSVFTSCYRCESHPVPSRDGLRVLFASIWTDHCGPLCGPATEIKAYIADSRPLRGVAPPDTAAPAGIGNISPGNAATSVSVTPTLTAAIATDATPPVSYLFELFTGSACSGTPVQTRAYGSSATWSPSPLTAGTVYAWHNKAKDSAVPANVSVFGACWTFTTSAPSGDTAAPSGVGNVSPANAASSVSATPTLTAASATDATTPITYTFELYTGSSCSGIPLQTSPYSTSTSWTPTVALSPGTVYAWRNKAKDSAVPSNESTFGPCWTFSTAAVTSTLSDTFESGSTAQWTPVTGSGLGGTWSIITDGATKVYQQSDPNNVDAYSTAGSANWTSYTVEAWVKPLTRGTGGFPRLIGRYQNINNYYYVRLGPTLLDLKKVVGGTASCVVCNAAATFPNGTWHRVTLEMIGTSLKVYIDGALVITALDTSLATGKIGLGTYYGTASFDNVKVTTPVSNDGGTIPRKTTP